MYNLVNGQTYFFQYRDEAGQLTARVLRVEEQDATSVTGYCFKRNAPRKLRFDRMYPPTLVSNEVAQAEHSNVAQYPSYWQ